MNRRSAGLLVALVYCTIMTGCQIMVARRMHEVFGQSSAANVVVMGLSAVMLVYIVAAQSRIAAVAPTRGAGLLVRLTHGLACILYLQTIADAYYLVVDPALALTRIAALLIVISQVSVVSNTLILLLPPVTADVRDPRPDPIVSAVIVAAEPFAKGH
jgi:hypothetical protein